MNLSKFNLEAILATGYAVGLQIIGAIVLFIVGRWLINFVIRLVNAGLKRQSFDPIIAGYIGSALHVLLNIILVISLLGWFGIQTTTFAVCWRRPRLLSEPHGADCWQTLPLVLSLLFCAPSSMAISSVPAASPAR